MAEIGEGYDTEFVTPPPDAFQCKCPICLLILKDPQQAKCCGKKFCKSCVEKALILDKYCPTCRSSAPEAFPDKSCKQELYKLRVHCSTTNCKWKGELCELNRHLNLSPSSNTLYSGCKLVSIQCDYCRKKFKRAELKHHRQLRCVNRPFTCPHCLECKGTYRHVTRNHYSRCLSFPIACPKKCKALIPRKEKQEHLDRHCPLVEVDCEYLFAGCKKKILRRDLCAHLNEVKHSELVISHLKSHITQLESEKSNQKKYLYDIVKQQLHAATLIKEHACELHGELEAAKYRCRLMSARSYFQKEEFQQQCEALLNKLKVVKRVRNIAIFLSIVLFLFLILNIIL